MVSVYDICARYRKAGVPLHIRQYAAPEVPRFRLYYGYAPAIAEGLTEMELRLVIHAVAKAHRKAVAA